MKKILELIKGLYNWLNTDGLLHISFTSMIITFSYPLIRWWSVGLSVLVGLAKEAYDILVKKSDSKLSIHDLICDCIGISMTVILMLVGYAGQRIWICRVTRKVSDRGDHILGLLFFHFFEIIVYFIKIICIFAM